MGSLLSALMLHGRVAVGASGAFMGLLGATLSSIFVNWRSYRHRSRTLAGVIFFIALNTVYGLMPFIDNFMHIGGAAMGFLLGNLFFIRHHLRYCWKSSAALDQDYTGVPPTRENVVLDIAWLLSLGALIVATIMGMFALFSGMVPEAMLFINSVLKRNLKKLVMICYKFAYHKGSQKYHIINSYSLKNDPYVTGMDMRDDCSWCQYLTCAPSHYWKCTSSRSLACNPSPFKGGLRVTCANGRYFDYSTIQYAAKLTPEIKGLCVKACV